MEKKRILIIGCGTAALSALRQIRKVDAEAEVKLLTMEPYLPYSPTSLPYVISGRMKESEITMVPPDFFDWMNAGLLRGRRVDHIDAAGGEVLFGSGEREPYDALLVATGSEPVLPPVPGLANGRALQLRTLDQARELMARAEGSETAIILGAGLIGMHAAQCLAEKGLRVKVVEMLPRILPAYFDQDAAGMIERTLEKHGVTFFTGSRVSEVRWREEGTEVFLEGKGTLKANLLLVATGVKPRTTLLHGSGVKANGGIVVDDLMRTNVANIYAAGDVAAAKGFLTGETGVNAILPNAAEQGKIAGSNMAGLRMEYEGWLQMNTFKFFEDLAVSVGKVMPSEGDEVLVEKRDDTGTYRKIICDGEKLLGATFLGTHVNGGVFQYLIRKRVEIGKYKRALLEAPRETSLWLMQEEEKRPTISMEE